VYRLNQKLKEKRTMQRIIKRLSLTTAFALALTVFSTAPALAADNAQLIRSGRTTVYLSAGFLNALRSLHVTPGVVSPTELHNNPLRVPFPITSGVIDLDNATTQILHSGGLTLTAGGKTVTLSSFIIDNTDSPLTISGLVQVNATLVGRVVLFDLTPPKNLTLPLVPSNGLLNLKYFTVKLDSAGASALNGVFGITALSDSVVVGTAGVYAALE
jgi:hypothetical protein